MTPEEKINALQMYIASRNTGVEELKRQLEEFKDAYIERNEKANSLQSEVEELKAENEKMRGALEKIIDRCERGIYDATDAAFIEEIARQAPTPLNKNKMLTPEQKEMESKEILQVAMALVRCGWQMACDDMLLWCADKKVSPQFTDQLIEMMDKEKKRQFNWVKLREEMEKMGIEHLMPKEKPNDNTNPLN
jgi:chromosome segregation ATPase